MMPVTRANLDHFCCICLLDLSPAMCTQKVYDVKEENLSKILKLTAHITILKNPINQNYINDYCRKICETCYVKTQYSYTFREKIISATVTLKELFESGELNKQYIERLKFFCRICLNRQRANTIYLNTVYLNWLKDCSGIRFTTMLDKETFRIKEGTNITEIAVINDTQFPQQLCQNCFKKLQNVEEFRKSSTKSFEYMVSVMGDAIWSQEYIKEDRHTKENITWAKEPKSQPDLGNCVKQECVVVEMSYNKYEVEGIYSSTNIFQNETPNPCCDVEPLINRPNLHQLEKDSFKNVLEFMDELSHYSDSSDENFTQNFINDFAACSENDNQNYSLGQIPAKNVKQGNINERNLRNKDNIEEESGTESVKQSRKSIMLSCNRKKPIGKSKNCKENYEKDKQSEKKNTNVKTDKETFFCEECSKAYISKYTYKRHQRTVHKFDKSKMLMCPICSKKFKRKSHLNDHVKAVHEKFKPFKCSHCPQTFSTKHSKITHELKHTEDNAFICNWCGKGFRQSSKLKIHLEIHTTNPELLCPICQRSQKSQNDLEKHLKQKHVDKRLQCPLCGKFFARSYRLKDHHNAVHLKLRPFDCHFCELTFGDRKTRRVHEKSHTEYRPLKCTVCNSGFNAQNTLTRHMHQFCHKMEDNEGKNTVNQSKS